MRGFIIAIGIIVGVFGIAKAETLTVTLTTSQGTLTATRTISTADEGKLHTAINDAIGGSPTPQQMFERLVDFWVAKTVSYVKDHDDNAARNSVSAIRFQ